MADTCAIPEKYTQTQADHLLDIQISATMEVSRWATRKVRNYFFQKPSGGLTRVLASEAPFARALISNRDALQWMSFVNARFY